MADAEERLGLAEQFQPNAGSQSEQSLQTFGSAYFELSLTAVHRFIIMRDVGRLHSALSLCCTPDEMVLNCNIRLYSSLSVHCTGLMFDLVIETCLLGVQRQLLWQE